MKIWIPTLFLLLSCTPSSPPDTTNSFEADLKQLMEYFHLPGLAAIVTENGKVVYENYLGYANLDKQQPVTAETRFPIASITKVFAATLIMQLVQNGQLSLDDPVNQYLGEGAMDNRVQVKHLLSHTSEGTPGGHFNYSPRFSWLTTIIEKASGQKMADLLHEQILQPLQLRHTVPLTQDAVDSLAEAIAAPYVYFGETMAGHYETGLSAASGLTATARDLAKFDQSLQSNSLLADSSREKMFTPFLNLSGEPQPYGLGIFAQNFMGEELVWGYGQEDCFSSLLLKVPERGLTMVLLANNNLMSNPPRLINGDVTYSLFTLNFLNHFVLDSPIIWSWASLAATEDLELNDPPNQQIAAFYRQELLAHALAASFMAQGHEEEIERSRRLIFMALEDYPDYLRYGNNTLLKLLTTLSTFGNFREFDQQLVQLGNELLSRNPHDPYCHIYLAYHYQNLGEAAKALHHFQTLASMKNIQPFWYTIEAYDYLGDYHKETNPSLAKSYYEKIVTIGWNMGGKLEKAKKELHDLSGE